MCGCSLNFTTLDVADLLNNQTTREAIAMNTLLSKADFMNRDLLTLMRFAHCANPVAFYNAFKSVGIDIDQANPDSDLVYLVDLHKSQGDIKGVVIGDNKQPIYFNVVEVFGTIRIPMENVARCNVKFV